MTLENPLSFILRYVLSLPLRSSIHHSLLSFKFVTVAIDFIRSRQSVFDYSTNTHQILDVIFFLNFSMKRIPQRLSQQRTITCFEQYKHPATSSLKGDRFRHRSTYRVCESHYTFVGESQHADYSWKSSFHLEPFVRTEKKRVQYVNIACRQVFDIRNIISAQSSEHNNNM